MKRNVKTPGMFSPIGRKSRGIASQMFRTPTVVPRKGDGWIL